MQSLMMELTDIHQHILPSIDDGAKDWEQSIEMLRICWEEGIHTVIATPHFDRYRYHSECADLPAVVEELNQRSREQEIGVQVLLGAEVFCEPGIYRRLREGKIPTLAGSRYVLVEYGYEEPFSVLQKNIQMLAEDSFTVVMAHVERYSCIRKDMDCLYDLKEDYKALVQVNASDLMGNAGFMMQRFCRNLLKKDLIDFIATDGHNVSSRVPRLKASAEYVVKKKGEAYAEKIFCENPQRIILNKRI